MISLRVGLPGSAKSYMSCVTIQDLLKRNRRWFKKTGRIRPVRSNLVLNPQFTAHANDKGTLELNKGVYISPGWQKWNAEHQLLEYWEDPEELPYMNNCDVIWEEMGAHVDSRSWEQLPHELRRWLQQHRHRGVNIFGNCQDFADIDVAVRRLCQEVTYQYKLIGSRDPSPTSFPPKYIWGLIMMWYLDPRAPTNEPFKNRAYAGTEWITRETVNLYSMFNDIKPGKMPPLRHVERTCPHCNKIKITHI